MDTVNGYQFILLGLLLGVAVGIAAMTLWLTIRRAAGITNRARRRKIACLMCGRSNRITPQEREQALLICRCGQPILLPGSLPQNDRRGGPSHHPRLYPS